MSCLGKKPTLKPIKSMHVYKIFSLLFLSYQLPYSEKVYMNWHNAKQTAGRWCYCLMSPECSFTSTRRNVFSHCCKFLPSVCHETDAYRHPCAFMKELPWNPRIHFRPPLFAGASPPSIAGDYRRNASFFFHMDGWLCKYCHRFTTGASVSLPQFLLKLFMIQSQQYTAF